MNFRNGAKAFIKNENLGKYLFFLRDDKPTIMNPNMWELLGGCIKEGEEPEETLRREIREETNLVISDIEVLGPAHITQTVEENGSMVTGQYTLHIFSAQTDMLLEDIELYEGQRLDYFTLDEIKAQRDLSPAMRDVIGQFEQKLIDKAK